MNNIIQLIAKKVKREIEESVIKVLEGDLNLWEGIKNLFGEEKYRSGYNDRYAIYIKDRG